MKYVYRNKNSGGVVTTTKPRDTFEASPNWELVEGPAPEAGAPAGAQPAQSVVADPADLDDAALIDLFLASATALKQREGTIDEAVWEAYREQIDAVFGEIEGEDGSDGDGEPKVDPESEVAGQTEIEATASAVKLAKEKGVDLRTLKGTGDGDRITVGDVRKAAEAA